MRTTLAFAIPALIGAFTANASAQVVREQQADVQVLNGMASQQGDTLTALEAVMNQEFNYIGTTCGSAEKMVDNAGGCRMPDGVTVHIDNYSTPAFVYPPPAPEPEPAVQPPEGYDGGGNFIPQDNGGGGGGGDGGSSGGGGDAGGGTGGGTGDGDSSGGGTGDGSGGGGTGGGDGSGGGGEGGE